MLPPGDGSGGPQRQRKSTLLACVNQHIPYTGTITEGEKNLALTPPKERAKTIAILPQTLPTPHITAREVAAFGRNPWVDFTGRLTETDKETVENALREGAEEQFFFTV